MGKTWEYIPENKDKLTNLEVLVNENGINGLFVQYNGISIDRLHEFFKLYEDAKYFSTKFFHDCTDEKYTFTDSHGRATDPTSPDAVFFSFETDDQDELEEMIEYLAHSCENQDLNINMTAHMGNSEFDIVADKDDIDYIGGEGVKGISYDQLESLYNKMSMSKSSLHK